MFSRVMVWLRLLCVSSLGGSYSCIPRDCLFGNLHPPQTSKAGDLKLGVGAVYYQLLQVQLIRETETFPCVLARAQLNVFNSWISHC